MNENTLIPHVENQIMVAKPKAQLSYLDAIKAIDAIAPDDRTAMQTYGMTAAQAKMVMWTGYEIGLSFTGALRVMYVSKSGKITLRPIGALALIQASGLMEKYEWEGDNNSQTIYLKRRGRPERKMTLTIQEAQKAGWKSDAWNATPQNMLRWRLIGWLADLDWTDLLIGLNVADDSWMDIEITPEGDVKSLVVENKPAIPDYGISLPRLMEIATQEEILEANNGAFPLPNQVNEVVHKLVQSGKVVLENEPAN